MIRVRPLASVRVRAPRGLPAGRCGDSLAAGKRRGRFASRSVPAPTGPAMISAPIDKALRSSRDPWERAQIGMRTFLDVCQQPNYRRICLQEAPVALGHERWQEAERESSYGLVERIVTDLLKDLGGQHLLAETFGVIFYGAMRSAGEFVADAADPEEASNDVETVIVSLLAGLRLLPAVGDDPSDAVPDKDSE